MADPLLDYNAYFANLLAPVRAYADRKVAIAEADKIFKQRQQAQKEAFQQQLDVEEMRMRRYLDVEDRRQEAMDARQLKYLEQQEKLEVAREKRQLALERERAKLKRRAEIEEAAISAGVDIENPDGTERSVADILKDKDARLAQKATRVRQDLERVKTAAANLRIASPSTLQISRAAIQEMANDGAFLAKLSPKSAQAIKDVAAARGDSLENVLRGIENRWFTGKDSQEVKARFQQELTDLEKTATDQATLQAITQQKLLFEEIEPLAKEYSRLVGNMSEDAAATFITTPAPSASASSAMDPLEAAKRVLAPTLTSPTPAAVASPTNIGPEPAPVVRPEAVLGRGLLTPPPTTGQWTPVRPVQAAPIAVGQSNASRFLSAPSPSPLAVPQGPVRPIPGMAPSGSGALRAGIPAADLEQMTAVALSSGQVTPQQVSAFTDRLNSGDPDAIAHLRDLHKEFLKGRAQNILRQSVPGGGF